jgi:hypothetical protein
VASFDFTDALFELVDRGLMGHGLLSGECCELLVVARGLMELIFEVSSEALVRGQTIAVRCFHVADVLL